MFKTNEVLKILAQPKASYRQRYESDRKRNKNSKQINRRFHAAEQDSGYKYPAIEVRYLY